MSSDTEVDDTDHHLEVLRETAAAVESMRDAPPKQKGSAGLLILSLMISLDCALQMYSEERANRGN